MLNEVKDSGLVWIDGVHFMHHKRLPRIRDEIEAMGGVTYVMSSYTLPAGNEDESFLEENIRVKPELEHYGVLGDLGWYNIRATLMAYSLSF